MNSGVLVLNSDYSPINVTSFKRGFNLVFKGKAEVVQSTGEPLITSLGEFLRPVIIRLLDYISYRPKKISVSKNRIMKRDKFRCVYCGSQKHLTIDHVIPKSKGGQNTWSNMVTCCSKCNCKKGDRTPEEAGLKSVYPKEPTMFQDVISSELLQAWESFKSTFWVFFCNKLFKSINQIVKFIFDIIHNWNNHCSDIFLCVSFKVSRSQLWSCIFSNCRYDCWWSFIFIRYWINCWIKYHINYFINFCK